MSHTIFFFNDTATTEIYTLSLHDALPIYSDDRFELRVSVRSHGRPAFDWEPCPMVYAASGKVPSRKLVGREIDRKSTRLNSSHQIISYAVFCLNKKNNHSASAEYFTMYSI